MINRVTNQTLVQSALRNLQSNQARMAELQNQASSRKAITRPSDDPAATADSLRVRAGQRATEQYERNIDDGNGWLTVADSAMATASKLLNKVRDLTVQGSNSGALSPAAKEAIAIELEGLKSELVAQANSTYLGRSVFAGNSDAPAAFVADPATGTVTFPGASAGTVERRISVDATVRVDVDGAAVFGVDSDPSTDSVFDVIDAVINDLRTGGNIGTHLGAIDDRMSAILGQRAAVGVRHAQIQRGMEANVEQALSLEVQRVGIEDVDLGKIILDLKLQEVTYQAALAVTARALQPTLMDFLR